MNRSVDIADAKAALALIDTNPEKFSGRAAVALIDERLQNSSVTLAREDAIDVTLLLRMSAGRAGRPFCGAAWRNLFKA
jgi:hypothetical protein